MEKNPTLKRMLDQLMEHNKLKNWMSFPEKSGCIMLKLRFYGDMSDNEDGEIVNNTSAMFRRKSDKQIERDFNRVKLNQQTLMNKNIALNDSLENTSPSQSTQTDIIVTAPPAPPAAPADEKTAKDSECVSAASAADPMLQKSDKAKESPVKLMKKITGKTMLSKPNCAPIKMKTPLKKLIHPVHPAVKRVVGHAYPCEKCQKDASDIDMDVYLCKHCSRGGKDRHVCSECFESSDHRDCYLTLIDFDAVK